MQHRGNTIAIFVASVLALAVLMAVGIYTYKHKEAEQALKEKDFLVSELHTTTETTSSLKNKIFEYEDLEKRLLKEMEHISQKNQDLVKENTDVRNQLNETNQRINAISKEREALLADIENLKSEKMAVVKQVQTIESKSFITDTLKEKAMLEIQITRLEEALKKANLNHTASLNKAQKYYTKEAEKMQKELQSVHIELDQAQTENQKITLLKKEVQIRDTTIRSLEDKVKDGQQLAQKLAKDLEQKTQDMDAQRQKMLAIQNEYNIGLNRLNDSQKKQGALEADLVKAQEVLQAKENEMKDLRSQLVDAQSKLKLRLQELSRAKDSIETIMARTRHSILESQTADAPIQAKTFAKPEAPVTPTVSGKAPAPLSGKVIEVDAKYDFVVVDKGAEDGVTAQMNVVIYQNNQIVANAQIIEIRPDISAVHIKVLGDYAVKAGDRVQFAS